MENCMEGELTCEEGDRAFARAYAGGHAPRVELDGFGLGQGISRGGDELPTSAVGSGSGFVRFGLITADGAPAWVDGRKG